MFRIHMIVPILLACALAHAQEPNVTSQPPATVSVASKGDDVRVVLHDLFTQVKKNYVLESDIRHSLFLSLQEVEFEEALAIICKSARIGYEVQNGIYFFARVAPKPATSQAKPLGKLPESALLKTVTVRLPKTDLRAVLAEFTKQTGVRIEADASVPLYKLDVFLSKTSLKYSLDLICRAAGLKYALTNAMSILVSKSTDENRITLVNTDG
jgi:hypothetical protein